MLKVLEGQDMSEKIRSFIAFDLQNDSVLNRLAMAQKLLIQTNADLKLVEPTNIHITLRFLGEISSEMIEKVYTVIKNVKFSPFNVGINGLGVFPTLNYPRIVWAGITEGADNLRNIFEQIEPQIHDLGFVPDPKGFSPHLTIARVRSGANKQNLVNLVTKQANYDFGIIRADCLRLKKSQISPRGPTYSTLKEYCP